MATPPLDYHSLDGQLAAVLDAPNWYVGFSGGMDSTVLLHLLQQWCQAHPGAPPLAAIHINHQLQTDANAWQRHCLQLGADLQVPVVCLAVDVGSLDAGPEAAAREARYQAFEAQLQAGDVLFLAHHLDDQIETFFLRLLRGAGVQGLAAMPVQRTLGRGSLARPLLATPRSQLEDYAGRHGLQHVEDPTNRDTAADRNFLRVELLPLLASRWPGYRQTVSRASGHLAGAAALLEQTLPLPATVFSAMGDPGFALDQVLQLPRATALASLRRWLQLAGLQAPDQGLLEEFLRQLLESGEQARPRLHCSAFILERYRDGVYLLPGAGFADGSPAPLSVAPGASCQLPAGGLICLEETSSAGLPGLVLAPGELLSVRPRLGGERCKPAGREGSSSLKKLLQAHDVPPWWRDQVPLLYLGDELLAVGDLWLCDSSRWCRQPEAGQPLWRPHWRRQPIVLPEGRPGRE